MPTLTFNISDLRDVPKHAEAVAQASFKEWGKMTELSIEEMRHLFNPGDPRGELPVTLVASRNNTFAGFVSLRIHTMGAIKHPEAYLASVNPWLSNMWIEEWARGQNLASMLTTTLDQIAHNHGYSKIYSSTAEPQSLYHKLGYQTLEIRKLGKMNIYQISKDLQPSLTATKT